MFKVEYNITITTRVLDLGHSMSIPYVSLNTHNTHTKCVREFKLYTT